MCLGHCKSQHEIPIRYNLKALGCLGFNKYLLEWNYRVSSEAMKMPLFVNMFLLEPAVLMSAVAWKPIQTGSSRSLLRAMSSLPCIVFKNLLLNYLFTPHLLCGHACVSMYVHTDAGVCVKAGVVPWSPSTLCLGTRSSVDLEPAG